MVLNAFSNGLRLVCTEKKDKKVACVVLYIAGGTQSEKSFQSGISEYLTKIMLMGTKKHSTHEALMSYAKVNGIVLTPHNSKESITISALCPKEKVGVAIELLSEIAFETTFSLDSGEKVRAVQLSQVEMLGENPQYVIDRLLNSTLYPRTGLANPKHGTTLTVSRFRSLDAKDFLEKVFTPRNTIISVVGDVNQDDIYELVKKHFFERMKSTEQEYKKLKYVSKIDDFQGSIKGRNRRLNQTRIAVAFPTIGFKDKQKYVLEIIKPILLRRVKLSLSNCTYYFDTKIKTKYFANNGSIMFDIMVDGAFAEDHLLNFVEALANDVKKRPIQEDEFEVEKREFITNFIAGYDNVVEYALISAKTLAITKQPFSENAERLKLEILSSKDANKLVNEILDFNKMVVIYLGQNFNLEYEEILSVTD